MDNKELSEKELDSVTGGGVSRADIETFIGKIHMQRGVSALGEDSLDVVDFVSAVENEFEIKVPKEDFCKLTTMSSITDYFYGKLNR